MIRAVEAGVAGVAAVALHLAGFAALGWHVPPGGAESAGAGGEALVTLAASDGSVARLVESWERPPDITVPATMAPAPLPEAAPRLDSAMTVAPSLPRPEPLPDLPRSEAPPVADVAPPPPPPPPPRPQPRPKPAPPAAPVDAEPEAGRAGTPAAEPAPAVAGQAASGAGGAAAAGNGGKSSAATAQGARAAELTAEWGAGIRARIERRKAYPRDGDGAEGTVMLRLVVGADGTLVGVGVARSSGSEALDRAAVKAVQRAGRFPKAPRGLGQGEVSFTLPISFRP